MKLFSAVCDCFLKTVFNWLWLFFFRRRGTISGCELRRSSALQTRPTNAQLQNGFVEQKMHESIDSQAPIELIHSENNNINNNYNDNSSSNRTKQEHMSVILWKLKKIKASHIYLFILSLLF
jgi:hypothetical protein